MGEESMWAVARPVDQIGGPGTRSGDANADPAGGPGVPVRGVGRALFVAGQNMTEGLLLRTGRHTKG